MVAHEILNELIFLYRKRLERTGDLIEQRRIADRGEKYAFLELSSSLDIQGEAVLEVVSHEERLKDSLRDTKEFDPASRAEILEATARFVIDEVSGLIFLIAEIRDMLGSDGALDQQEDIAFGHAQRGQRHTGLKPDQLLIEKIVESSERNGREMMVETARGDLVAIIDDAFNQMLYLAEVGLAPKDLLGHRQLPRTMREDDFGRFIISKVVCLTVDQAAAGIDFL